MSIIEQVRNLTGDNTITDSDKLYTIKLTNYCYTIIYETRSDYLYMVDVFYGKVKSISTYELLGTTEGLEC